MGSFASDRRPCNGVAVAAKQDDAAIARREGVRTTAPSYQRTRVRAVGTEVPDKGPYCTPDARGGRRLRAVDRRRAIALGTGEPLGSRRPSARQRAELALSTRDRDERPLPTQRQLPAIRRVPKPSTLCAARDLMPVDGKCDFVERHPDRVAPARAHPPGERQIECSPSERVRHVLDQDAARRRGIVKRRDRVHAMTRSPKMIGKLLRTTTVASRASRDTLVASDTSERRRPIVTASPPRPAARDHLRVVAHASRLRRIFAGNHMPAVTLLRHDGTCRRRARRRRASDAAAALAAETASTGARARCVTTTR